jgi:predicted HTH domain antitoxin
MFHPFEGDLSELSDTELNNKLSELNRKYYTAARLGKNDLLTQLQTFVTIYRDEITKRAISAKYEQDDKDLDQLINVD